MFDIELVTVIGTTEQLDDHLEVYSASLRPLHHSQ